MQIKVTNSCRCKSKVELKFSQKILLQSMMDIGISGPMVLFNWDCNQRQSSIAFSKIKLVSSTPIQAHKTLKRKSEEIM